MPHDCITMQTFSVTGAGGVNRIKKNRINRLVSAFRRDAISNRTIMNPNAGLTILPTVEKVSSTLARLSLM